MIRLAVAGARGRMGRAVIDAAGEHARVEVVAALVAPQACVAGSNVVRIGERELSVSQRLTAECDVLVEFAGADGSMTWLETCRARKLPLVMGSTGHTDEQLSSIRTAAEHVAIVKSANFSLGIHTLLECVARMRKVLGLDYDVEIVETHHRNKTDAPSGTALTILDAIHAVDAASPAQNERDVIFGRKGRSEERPRGQIGVHAVRMGEVVGQHEIHFSGPGEILTVRHAALSRLAFAQGALRAAEWIVGKEPGLYSMSDVLGM